MNTLTTMKAPKPVLFWIVTGLFAALMTLSAVPDIFSAEEAVKMVTDHLGYPAYFLPFIGVAKLLGAVALVLPGMPRLKEWAFAGFTFDLIAAMYSSHAVGDPAPQWLPLLIGLALLAFAYRLHRRKERALATASGPQAARA